MTITGPGYRFSRSVTFLAGQKRARTLWLNLVALLSGRVMAPSRPLEDAPGETGRPLALPGRWPGQLWVTLNGRCRADNCRSDYPDLDCR